MTQQCKPVVLDISFFTAEELKGKKKKPKGFFFFFKQNTKGIGLFKLFQPSAHALFTHSCTKHQVHCGWLAAEVGGTGHLRSLVSGCELQINKQRYWMRSCMTRAGNLHKHTSAS